jgi:serine/threonine-protein kinase
MSTIQIRLLRGVWQYDPAAPLGPPGGFGAVFLGTDSEGNEVAVKRLHLDAAEAAHRELKIAADLADRDLPHVMPVLDAGQDAKSDGYFVVMPRAERSLQQYLTGTGPIPESEAVEILDQIAAGLQEAAHIVHRDLKPANVLQHEGRWRITDYGIARFVEDSTSARTLKDCLSAHYAAPEQWRMERAVNATDVYALGCVAHALLRGHPPFVGTRDEIREAHLHHAPPQISAVSSSMRSAVEIMLRKSPAGRASVDRVRTVLQQVRSNSGSAQPNNPLHKLAAASAAHERAQSIADAEAARVQDHAAQRRALASDAAEILRDLARELGDRVTNSIPNSRVTLAGAALSVQVASASLTISASVLYGVDAFPRSKWDVVAGATVRVVQSDPHHERSASLWFTRQDLKGGDYRWYEVGYEGNPLTGHRFPFQPSLGDAETADRAHSNAIDIVQKSYYPLAVDGEDSDAFCDRWLHILAEACDGKLQHLAKGLPSFGA